MKNTEAAGLPLKRGSAEAFEKAPYLRNPLLRRIIDQRHVISVTSSESGNSSKLRAKGSFYAEWAIFWENYFQNFVTKYHWYMNMYLFQ